MVAGFWHLQVPEPTKEGNQLRVRRPLVSSLGTHLLWPRLRGSLRAPKNPRLSTKRSCIQYPFGEKYREKVGTMGQSTIYVSSQKRFPCQARE